MALSGRLLLGSPAWTNVAGRIVGAWLVAIAGLLLAAGRIKATANQAAELVLVAIATKGFPICGAALETGDKDYCAQGA
jgi:hypothetical protein